VWHSENVVIVGIFFFLFGLVIGSFLNVCITRIPEDISIVSPGSRCPKCGTPIKAYDNVPVLGWLWLRGKCRACGAPISAMYPLVELATGLLFVAALLEYGITQAAVKWLFFTCLILVLTITDLRVRLLPDLITLPGLAVGLLFSGFVPPGDAMFGDYVVRKVFGWDFSGAVGAVMEGILGAVFGSFLLWGVAKLYKVVRGREGMGMGDVKMMAMAGAFLGVRGTFLMILFGSVLGSVIGISVVLALYLGGWRRAVAKRGSRRGLGTESGLRWTMASQYQLPLGTFLGLGALAIVYLGPLLAGRWVGLRGVFGS
jgi:leader peptidase (prepilin peptidase)/N-methyltransferase